MRKVKRTRRVRRGWFRIVWTLAIGVALLPVTASAQTARVPEYFGLFFDGKGGLVELDKEIQAAFGRQDTNVYVNRASWEPVKVEIEEKGSVIVYDEQYDVQKFRLFEYFEFHFEKGIVLLKMQPRDLRVSPVSGATASCYRLVPKSALKGTDYILVYGPSEGVVEKAWQFAVYRDRKMNPIREEIVTLVASTQGYPTVWASTPGGLFAKYENGWEFRSTRRFTLEFLASDPQQSDALYSVFVPEGRTFHRTLNGGQTWDPVSLPAEMKAKLVVVYRPSRINAIAISPTEPNRILVGAEGASGLGGGRTGMIILSEDGGKKWKLRKSDCSIPKTICFDPTNPEVAYVGTGNEMLRGKKSGEKWKKIKKSPRGVTKMAIDPSTGVIVVWSPFGLFRSSDGGDSWAKLSGWQYSIINPVTGIAFLESSSGDPSIFVSCNEGVFSSSDNGETWAQASRGIMDRDIRALATHMNSGRLYAATPSGIFASSDAGANWTAE